MKTPPLPGTTQPKSTIALGIKISAILFATTAIFHQDLTVIANEAIQSELMTHILAIPFLLIYLIYRKKRNAANSRPFKSMRARTRPAKV